MNVLELTAVAGYRGPLFGVVSPGYVVHHYEIQSRVSEVSGVSQRGKLEGCIEEPAL